MSTATRQVTVADQHRAALEQCDERVEHQLRQTLSQVRMIDLMSGLMRIAIRMLVVILLVSLLDHWVIALPGWSRLATLILLAAVAIHGLLRNVLPLLLWRLNPLYAAEQIEKSVPSLKTGLINYVLLRKSPEQVHLSILGALGRSAATQLSDCEEEHTIDHGQALRTGYLLVIVFALFAAYTILSPKSPLQTLHRVLAPWGEIARPSRVEFLEIEPGNQEVYFAQSVLIRARLSGVRQGEPVEMVYQSGGETAPQQRIALKATDHTSLFELDFPESAEGIQQTVHYRLEAGDAVSESYTLTVLPAPTIVVQEIQYRYPDYTGLKPRTVTDKTDITALEGTRVTIIGKANGAIETASLRLFTSEAARPLSRGMHVDVNDNQQASNELLLKLREDRRTAEFSGFELEFLNDQKQRSTTAIRHRIAVTPDFSPEIELLEPQRPLIQVPLNGSLSVEVRAIDPDFGLSRVAVENSNELPPITLLSDSEGLEGQFLKRFALVPARLGLKAGDTYTFQLVAEDNRHDPFGQLQPNRSETHAVTIEVTEPDTSNPPRQPQNMDEAVDPDGMNEGKPEAGTDGDSGSTEDGDQGDGGDPNPGDKGNPGEDGNNDSTAGKPGGDNDSPESGDEGPEGKKPDPNNKPAGSDTESQASDSGAEESGEKPSTPGGEGNPDQAQQPGAGDQDPDGQQGSGGEQDDNSGDPHDGDVIQRVLDRIKKEKQQQRNSSGDSSNGEGPDGGAELGGGTDGAGDKPNSGNQQPADGSDSEGGKPTGEKTGGDQKPAGDANPGDKPTGSQRKPGAGQGENGNQRPAEGQKPGENTSKVKKPGENADRKPGSGEKPAAGGDGDDQGDPKKPGMDDNGDPDGDSKPGEDGDGPKKPTEKPGEGNPEDKPQPGSSGSDSEATNKPSENEGPEGDSGNGQQKPNSASAGNNPGTSSSGAAGSNSPGKSNDNPSGTGEGGSRRPDASSSGQDEADGLPNELVGLPDNVPESDEARLDYAEKATNLVLDYLKAKQHDPDPELLKESGLTAEQLREMVSRYERLKRKAEASPEGRRELDDTLRSLGLNPQSSRAARQVRRPDRLIEGVSNAGTRSQPPSGLLDKFNAFKKGTALSDQ